MLLKRLTFVGILTSVCLTVSAAAAETVTIKYSNWLPAKYFALTDVIEPWFAEIEKVTEGRVKVEILPKVVGTPASQFDVVRDGLADAAWFTTGFTPGRFPVAEFADLPLTSDRASIHAPVYDRIYRKYLEDFNEYDGVHVLTTFPISASHFFVKGKIINEPEDIAGLKLRAPSTNVIQIVSLLNGVPITRTPAEAYEMLSTGVIDGQVTLPSTLVGFNQADLTDSAYIVPGGLTGPVSMIIINNDTWAKISEADREAIMAISADKVAAKFGAAWEAQDINALKVLKADYNYNIVEASPEAVERMRTLFAPIEQDWIKRAKEKGYDKPEELLAAYRAALIEEAKKQ